MKDFKDWNWEDIIINTLAGIIVSPVVFIVKAIFITGCRSFVKNIETESAKIADEKCKVFYGQKIDKMQIPKYLIFSDGKYLIANEELFKKKKVGDTFNKEDCAYIDWNGDDKEDFHIINPRLGMF